MSNIAERQQAIIDQFTKLSPDERMKHIIELGRAAEAMDDALLTDDNLLRGCASKAWFHARLSGATVEYQGQAEAIMSNGLIALMLSVYNGQSPADIVANPPDFIEQIGLNASLSPNRANGLASMAKQIRTYAVAFQHMLKR